MLSLVVSYIYRNSDNIIAQSKGFKQNINKYVKKKIYIVENSHFNIQTKKIKIPLKIENILKNKFCITFSGNIGKAQSIPTIIDACRKLTNYKNIHFLLIGGGSEVTSTKKLIKKFRLKNISIFGPYPSGLTFDILKKSKATILTLKKSKIFSDTIPNKFQTYLYAGKPILISANGEVARLAKKNQLGLISNAENSEKLKENIIKLTSFKMNKIKKIKKNCINFYNYKYNINNQVNKLINIMENG